MKIKYFLLLITLSSINTIDCSLNPREQFQALQIPPFRLASRQDVEYLKNNPDSNKTIESQLHDLLNHYSLDYHYCKAQKKLCKFTTFSLAVYSLVNVYFGLENEFNNQRSFFEILAATALIKGALYAQSLEQNYDHDQKLLIQKCCTNFELEDLTNLQKFYTETNEHDHLQFLNEVVKRQEWIQQAQAKH